MGWGAGEGAGESVFNGCRVSVWEDEKVLEMNVSDGDNVITATELLNLKAVKILATYKTIFYHNCLNI